MQRTVNDRSSHVLVFGQTFDQWREWKSLVKGGLQSAHMGWVFTSILVYDVTQIVNWIQDHDGLELLYITNEAGVDLQTIIQGIPKISLAINRHKYQPWVILDMGTSHLKPFFEKYQVRVEEGMIEHVIFHRWSSQIAREETRKKEEKITDEEASL